MPTNVALTESLFLAEFCIAGQRSIFKGGDLWWVLPILSLITPNQTKALHCIGVWCKSIHCRLSFHSAIHLNAVWSLQCLTRCNTLYYTVYYIVLHFVLQCISMNELFSAGRCFSGDITTYWSSSAATICRGGVQHEFCHLLIRHLYVAKYELRYYRVFFYEINCWNTTC